MGPSATGTPFSLSPLSCLVGEHRIYVRSLSLSIPDDSTINDRGEREKATPTRHSFFT